MKNVKIILTTVLALFALLGLQSMTEAAPIQIRTCSDLSNMRNDLSGEYELASDIDCSSHGDFQPVGEDLKSFRGTIDGKGFKIIDVTINSLANHVGIIGDAEEATIKNIIVDGIKIRSEGNIVGGIVGRAFNVKIHRCFVGFKGSKRVNSVVGKANVGGISGLVTGGAVTECVVANTVVESKGIIAGGIVGDLSKSKIERCFNLGFLNEPEKLIVVAGNYQSGGVCGVLVGSKMEQCGTERGKVKAKSEAGGVAGASEYSNITQAYSLAEVNVEASENSGGLFGKVVLEVKNSNVQNSFSRASKVSAVESGAGGLFGEIIYESKDANFDFSDCFSTSSVESPIEGAVVGTVTQNDAKESATTIVKNVLFDNSKNEASVGAVGGFKPESLSKTFEGQKIEALSSQELDSKVKSSFNQKIWDGENLKVEKNIPNPFVQPTQAPTQEPTQEPTEEPTQAPTQEPTEEPTQEPTEEPTPKPTSKPDNSARSLAPLLSLVFFVILSLIL